MRSGCEVGVRWVESRCEVGVKGWEMGERWELGGC